jgi:hypothetical protein
MELRIFFNSDEFFGTFSFEKIVAPAAMRYPAEVRWRRLHREDLANLYTRAPRNLKSQRAPRQNEKPACQRAFVNSLLQKSGAGEGIRTLDPDLGKVVLYH